MGKKGARSRRAGPRLARDLVRPVVGRGGGQFVPPVFRTSLRIAFERASAAATSLGTIVFSGNNVQDPLLSAGSEQPPGFAYLATMYNRYRVLGSRVELRGGMGNNSSGTAAAFTGDLAIYPSNTSSAPSDYETAVAQPLAKYRELTVATPTLIRHAMTTARMTGQQGVNGADRLQAAVTTVPAEEWYWVTAFKSDAAYTNGILEYHIQITYDVEFFDRSKVDQSLLSWKFIKQAYLARCAELEAEAKQEEKRKTQAADEMRKRWESFAEAIVETKQEHKTSNDEVHDRWVKLRNLDPILMPAEVSGGSRAIAVERRVVEPPTPPTSRSSSRK